MNFGFLEWLRLQECESRNLARIFSCISVLPSFQGGARARGAVEEDEGAGGEVGRRQDGPAHRGARQEVGRIGGWTGRPDRMSHKI